MPRPIPPPPPPLTVPLDTRLTVQLQTITPLFGGSARTREVDEHHPVRAASVRGHLRFWWRATAGAAYPTSAQLFEEETKLWGSAEQHGTVRVEVLSQEAQRPRIPQLSRELTYATFPFQEQRGMGGQPGTPASEATSVSFALCVTSPADYLPQIQTALQAWVMFGGIGSRTRRGCGSLAVVAGSLPSVAFSAQTARGDRLLTLLPARYYLGNTQNDPLRAWEEAVRTYKDFRQGEGVARTPADKRGGSKTPGRSYFPEPDTIRRLRRKYFDGPDKKTGVLKQHEPTHEVQGFPRADLGLPIIFHFKDEGRTDRHDPTDQELRGQQEKQLRFASPVITKVVAVGKQFAPLIMVLNAPHIWEGEGVVLVDQKSLPKVISPISKAQLQVTQSGSPLNNLPVREALLQYIQTRGFREERLQEVPL